MTNTGRGNLGNGPDCGTANLSGAREGKAGTARPGVFAGVLVAALVVAPLVAASPPVDLDWIAFQRYESGDVEGGRAFYEEEMEAWLNRVRGLSASPPNSAREADNRTEDLLHGFRKLSRWLFGEMWYRYERDGEVPEAALADIVGYATSLLEYRHVLAVNPTDFPESERRKALEVSLRCARTEIPTLLLQLTVSVRGTQLESERGRLLEAAGDFTEVPASVAEFDAENPDPKKLLGIYEWEKWQEYLAQLGSTAPATPRLVEVTKEHPIGVLVTSYLQRFFDSDLQGVRELCVEGYWPEEALTATLQEYPGRRLVSIGNTKVQDIGDEEFEVAVDDIWLTDPDGSRVKGGDYVIVRRTATGDYKISFFGSREERKLAEKGVEW